MSAEDYDDVPGLGSMNGNYKGPPMKPRTYQCYACRHPITFTNKKPFNEDGTPHRCISKARQAANQEQETPPQAAMFAMAAMNAIISASIQAGGVDFIHHINFYDVADASWRIAAAMTSAEKNFRYEFGGAA